MQKKREGLSGTRRRHYFYPLDVKSLGEGPLHPLGGSLGLPLGAESRCTLEHQQKEEAHGAPPCGQLW